MENGRCRKPIIVVVDDVFQGNKTNGIRWIKMKRKRGS